MTMNVGIDRLEPGTFGLSHGGGSAGELIRTATQSDVGHAFLYLGGNVIVQGQPPVAALAAADSHQDAIWAYRMWDWLRDTEKWSEDKTKTAQAAVVLRGHALVGVSYDFEAYAAFTTMVLKLRNADQLAPLFARDAWRVCSALVADALSFGRVPLQFVPSDGPGLIAHPEQKVTNLPPNLITPGMLDGISQRLGWI